MCHRAEEWNGNLFGRTLSCLWSFFLPVETKIIFHGGRPPVGLHFPNKEYSAYIEFEVQAFDRCGGRKRNRCGIRRCNGAAVSASDFNAVDGELGRAGVLELVIECVGKA